VADPDADPDLEFWVDEELDGQLMARVTAELDRALTVADAPLRRPAFPVLRRVGRNEPCPCGSGRKYKRCCLG
jgi:uncharacterized protein YecA (UPF0149 family)